MNSHEIFRIAVKIVGLVLLIYAVIDGIIYFPVIIKLFNSVEGEVQALSYFASFFAQIVIGLLLWLFPAPVASTIIKNDLTVTSQDKLLPGIEKVGIRLLGIYLLYQGITGLISNYASYSQAIEMFGENIKFGGNEKYRFNFIGMWVEIFLSILLILGASGIANVIRKIRYAS